MTTLRTSVQSFDLFDTLIARACITPANLFAEVELALQVPGFAQCRMEAERRVALLNCPFGLDTIYEAMRESGFCDDALACRLQKAEIEAEFDNAIPIAHNLAAVRDHDLVVSDMYLPASILRGLLQQVGLRRHVHLFVSNRGKHDGSIWPLLTEKWLLLHHTGDNPHADVFQAQRFHIPTRHYTDANLTRTEHFLDSNGLPHISRLIRRLRLANPFKSNSLEADIWDIFVQLNVPILCLAAETALRQRDALQLKKILFLSRDCHFFAEFFSILQPGEPFELLHVSRNALHHNPKEYDQYLRANNCEIGLVIDMVSTGLSWLRHTESARHPITFFTVIYIDNYKYQPFDSSLLENNQFLGFHYAVRCSELDSWSLAIEVMNTAPHGSTMNIELVGDSYVPRFEERHELEPSLLQTLQLAQAAAVKCLRDHRRHVSHELAQTSNTQGIIRYLVSTLSSIGWLNRFANEVICNTKT